jgi:hypothetical protein
MTVYRHQIGITFENEKARDHPCNYSFVSNSTQIEIVNNVFSGRHAFLMFGDLGHDFKGPEIIVSIRCSSIRSLVFVKSGKIDENA